MRLHPVKTRRDDEPTAPAEVAARSDERRFDLVDNARGFPGADYDSRTARGLLETRFSSRSPLAKPFSRDQAATSRSSSLRSAARIAMVVDELRRARLAQAEELLTVGVRLAEQTLSRKCTGDRSSRTA